MISDQYIFYSKAAYIPKNIRCTGSYTKETDVEATACRCGTASLLPLQHILDRLVPSLFILYCQ